MGHPSVVLVGQSPEVEGLRWQSSTRLRIGRFSSDVDVVLSDATISPHHAEVVVSRHGWVVRDLGSMHGTLLNGASLQGKQQLLRDNDRLQFGRLLLGVKMVQAGDSAAAPQAPEREALTPPAFAATPPSLGIKATNSFLRIQASTQQTWEQAIDSVTGSNSRPWQDRHMRALLRASYSVCKVASPEELLQAVLDDTVAVLEAQRGAILLADEETGQLHLRSLSLARATLRNRGTHSHTLAERCYRNGESLLCADVRMEADLLNARSVTHGAMTSIICTLLRTPRGRLGVLHLDRGPLQEPFTQDQFQLADALAATVSVGIESAQLVQKQRQQFVQTVAALGMAVEVRDLYTANHTNRVTEYALLLARELRVPAAEQNLLQIGTPLHDIGKIGIADAILRKPTHLTPDEFEQMKTHTVKGAAILSTVPSLQAVVPIARSHHERWDGSGYPDGLAGDRTSLVARIVAVADAFDAMTSNRPYRPALPMEQAFAELAAKAGTHFDPACVRAFLAQRPQVEAICRRHDSNAAMLAVLEAAALGPTASAKGPGVVTG